MAKRKTNEERIERAVGPYIDAVGHAWDPKRAVRALRVEFGDELTPAIEQRALQMILKRIQDKRILEGYAKWKAGHSLLMSKPETEKVASNDILLSKTRRP
jgi:hypothetical protein